MRPELTERNVVPNQLVVEEQIIREIRRAPLRIPDVEPRLALVLIQREAVDRIHHRNPAD